MGILPACGAARGTSSPARYSIRPRALQRAALLSALPRLGHGLLQPQRAPVGPRRGERRLARRSARGAEEARVVAARAAQHLGADELAQGLGGAEEARAA